MLEKKRQLRHVEFTFTDDQVHPVCHCEYEEIVLEDGVELMRKKHRVASDCDEMRQMLQAAAMYRHPEVNP